jgi:hypothetical protein
MSLGAILHYFTRISALPLPRSQLETEFTSLESSNGKKALAWIEHVNQLRF